LSDKRDRDDGCLTTVLIIRIRPFCSDLWLSDNCKSKNSARLSDTPAFLAAINADSFSENSSVGES